MIIDMRHLKLAGGNTGQIITKMWDFIHSAESQEHKLTNIKHIFDHASVSHQFVLVGDSGERDPEVRV